MLTYLIVSVSSGILFGLMDGLIHGNPSARKLLAFYQPIAKTRVNIPTGLTIDLIYGFVLAGLYMALYWSLPGTSGAIKGLAFGVMLWFLRTVMSVASQWMTLQMPVGAVFYLLYTGLLEMLALGLLYGLTLKAL